MKRDRCPGIPKSTRVWCGGQGLKPFYRARGSSRSGRSWALVGPAAPPWHDTDQPRHGDLDASNKGAHVTTTGLGIRTDSRMLPAYVEIERRQQHQAVIPEVAPVRAQIFDLVQVEDPHVGVAVLTCDEGGVALFQQGDHLLTTTAARSALDSIPDRNNIPVIRTSG